MEKSDLWQYLCEFIVHGKKRELADSFLECGKIPLLEEVLNERNTLLHIAAMGGSAEMVAALLEAGASPTIKNNSGQIPIDVAHNDEVHKLLKAAIDARVWVDKIARKGEGLSR